MSINKNDFSQFMNQARVHLPGASDGGIKAELFDTMREFFDISSCWTENITVAIVPAIVDYTLVPAEDGEIIRLAGVIDENNIPQSALLPTLTPPTATMSLPVPQSNPHTWTATVVKNVVLPVTEDSIPLAPQFSLPVYGLVILDGVLGKMMMQPNKSYTNDTYATYHLRRFRNGMAGAKTAALRRNTFGSQAWSFPQTFASKGQRGGVSVGNQTRF